MYARMPEMKMYIPPKGQPTRRSFLKRGLLGGAVLALGGGLGLALRASKEVPLPAEPLLVLSPQEFSVVAALGNVFITPREGFPPPDQLKVAAVSDKILSMTDVTAQKELKQALMLFENALPNFLFGARLLPFTRLGPAEQAKVLSEWFSSRLPVRRTAALALRALVTAAYFSQRESWPAVHYGGPLPGIHDPNAPLWKGGGAPRPPGNGVWLGDPL